MAAQTTTPAPAATAAGKTAVNMLVYMDEIPFLANMASALPQPFGVQHSGDIAKLHKSLKPESSVNVIFINAEPETISHILNRDAERFAAKNALVIVPSNFTSEPEIAKFSLVKYDLGAQNATFSLPKFVESELQKRQQTSAPTIS